MTEEEACSYGYRRRLGHVTVALTLAIFVVVSTNIKVVIDVISTHVVNVF